MSNFFVEFMENDRLGLISTYHLQLADRLDDGLLNPVCIELANLASTAVDYAKSGIKVNQHEIPKFDKTLKPDFMAPNPRVHIEKGKVVLEEKVAGVRDAYELFHDEGSKKYYYSEKALGKLFRRIDEKKFFHKREHSSRTLEALWGYVNKAATGVQWWGNTKTAKHIRDAYEDNVEDIAEYYANRQKHPLLELEVVIGTMFGASNRRSRSEAKAMKERYTSDAAYTRTSIQTGEDGSRDEALACAIACFSLAMNEPGRKMGNEGSLVSFKYLAAALCLEELEKFHGKLRIF